MDKNKLAVDIFNNRALDYQQKFMSVGLYEQSLDFFCDSISQKNAEVLEITCGPGNITKYLLQKRPDFKILVQTSHPTCLNWPRSIILTPNFK